MMMQVGVVGFVFLMKLQKTPRNRILQFPLCESCLDAILIKILI